MAPFGSLLVLLTIVNPIFSYKILAFCPFPANSHYNLCRGIVDTLADRGHELTLVSPYVAKNVRFRDINVPEILSLKEKMNPGFHLSKMSIFETMKFLTNTQTQIIEHLFKDERFLKLFNDKSEKFDAVLFEYFFNDVNLGFGVKYDCPVIAMSPVSPMQWLTALSNNPTSPATVPNVFTAFTGQMTLWERMANFLIAVMQEVLGKIYIRPAQISSYEKYFPEESKKVPYDELASKLSGILINSHPSIGVARALLPNSVEIGGYHIKDPEPLPEEMKKILDESKNGVIYFSMGSNLNSKDMTPEMKALILKAFRGLKHTVLWKYEEDLPDKPKNLIIRKWMPQTGILAHPNVKLFISHGGLLSLTEAAHFGVPLLAIPIFGDQNHNANLLRERGNGVMLEFLNVTEPSFEWALKEVLENPKYTEKAKEVHRLYHDRPISPRDLLSFHVEHIIRSKGAKHLAPVPLCRCSHLLLDVFGVLLVPVFIIGVLFLFVVWKCFCARKNRAEKVEKKQKKQ